MFTLVRGRFTSFRGTVVIDPPHPAATLIDVDIDASSVVTAMPVRDAQVRGEEFCDVSRHPKLPSPAGDGAGGRSLHGAWRVDDPWHQPPVRRVVDVLGPAPDVLGHSRLGLRATAKVQGAVWGINWNAPVPGGGVALAGEVDLELDVSLVPAGTASRPS